MTLQIYVGSNEVLFQGLFRNVTENEHWFQWMQIHYCAQVCENLPYVDFLFRSHHSSGPHGCLLIHPLTVNLWDLIRDTRNYISRG